MEMMIVVMALMSPLPAHRDIVHQVTLRFVLRSRGGVGGRGGRGGVHKHIMPPIRPPYLPGDCKIVVYSGGIDYVPLLQTK